MIMPKVKVYNQNGEVTSEMNLKEDVFGVKIKTSVVHQVYTAIRANTREPWAHTKDKGEVRGGGRKPWKQKGTGRARHGSIRSPLWKGGGVTFGPLKERNYGQKINKKMKESAFCMMLADRVADNKFIVLEDLPATEKTKEMAGLRRKLPGMGKSALFILTNGSNLISRSIKNLPKTVARGTGNVSVLDLMHNQYVITTKKAVEVLEKKFS